MKARSLLFAWCIMISGIYSAKSQILYHFATVHSPASCASTYDIDITLSLDSVQVTNIYFDDGTNGSLGFKAFVSYQNIFSNSTLPPGDFFTFQFSLFTDNPDINPQVLTNDAGVVPLQTASAGGFSFQNNPTYTASASSLGLVLNGVYSSPNILLQLGYDSATLEINLPCLDTVIETNDSGTLPVLWSPLSASLDGNEVLLKWQTFMELNNAGFTIQRSLEGSNWRTADFIQSKALNGNSAEPIQYQYTQTEKPGGRYLYRIIQRDIDGTSVISNVVTVSISEQQNQNFVYPNPAQGMIYLRKIPANTRFSIVNIHGQIVLEGYYVDRIDVSRLIPGVYWVKTETMVSRFMKN